MPARADVTEGRTWRDIAALFRTGQPAELTAFIQACPDFPMRDQAVTLAGRDMPGARSLALGIVGQGLAFGRAAAFGAEVELAAHALLREDFDRYPGTILPFTLSRAASEALTALNLSGRYKEALAFADEVGPLYDDEPQNGSTIRVARITALYQLGRIDEAKAAIPRERARGVTPAAQIELDRLDRLVAAMTGDATERRVDRPETVVSEQLAEENRQGRELLDRFTSLLAGSGTEMNEWRAMQLIRDGTAIFTHPSRGRDPALLRDSLAKLKTARDWAQHQGSSAHENDALWGMYLCLDRLAEPAEAATALQALRANLERPRANIANPIERGGITSHYPFLFPALCKMLAQTRNGPALLEAMEGAKGRAVADLLVKRSGAPMQDRSLAEPAARLPALMQRERAHYLSYFVDEDETYAVLVGKDGSIHQAESIPLGRVAIRSAAERADPRMWQDDPVSQRLASLVTWLAAHRASGLLQDGDHICYSPDEHLHQVPLHVLEIDGAPLVERFSLSRTHGAAALSILLGRAAPARPSRYLAVEVPTLQNTRLPGFEEGLARARVTLGDYMSGGGGEALIGAAARPEALGGGRDLTHRIVHFATHGRFPRGTGADGVQLNPYTKSGLLLAGPNGLPDEVEVSAGRLEAAFLTPQRILDMELDLAESHVTMQACVSGLSEEGLGGDALGLDWALMQAGARSVLASHWNISLGLSAEFFDRFYQYWLEEGLTRAHAWWSTIRDLRAAGGELRSPYCWAAFSLSGDWR
jgi:CHAT domain-containing protein